MNQYLHTCNYDNLMCTKGTDIDVCKRRTVYIILYKYFYLRQNSQNEWMFDTIANLLRLLSHTYKLQQISYGWSVSEKWLGRAEDRNVAKQNISLSNPQLRICGFLSMGTTALLYKKVVTLRNKYFFIFPVLIVHMHCYSMLPERSWYHKWQILMELELLICCSAFIKQESTFI